MKSNYLFITVLSLIVCCGLSCSKKVEDAENNDECHYIYTYSPDKPILKGGKGWILFSWKQNNKWNYALDANLNVRQAGINPKNTITGKNCLKINLDLCEEGVELFWFGKGTAQSENETIGLSFPSSEIIDEIKSYCEQKNLKLTVDK